MDLIVKGMDRTIKVVDSLAQIVDRTDKAKDSSTKPVIHEPFFSDLTH